METWVGLQYVIVVVPDHTHYFHTILYTRGRQNNAANFMLLTANHGNFTDMFM